MLIFALLPKTPQQTPSMDIRLIVTMVLAIIKPREISWNHHALLETLPSKIIFKKHKISIAHHIVWLRKVIIKINKELLKTGIVSEIWSQPTLWPIIMAWNNSKYNLSTMMAMRHSNTMHLAVKAATKCRILIINRNLQKELSIKTPYRSSSSRHRSKLVPPTIIFKIIK